MMSVDGSVDCQWAVNVADHVGWSVRCQWAVNVTASVGHVGVAVSVHRVCG